MPAAVWQELLAEEVAGNGEGRFGKDLIFKIFVSCRNKGGKKKRDRLFNFYLFICFFGHWGSLPSIDFGQRNVSLAKTSGQMWIIHSLPCGLQQRCLLILNRLDCISEIPVTLGTSCVVTVLKLSGVTGQNRRRLLHLSYIIKIEVSDQKRRLGDWAPVKKKIKIHVILNSILHTHTYTRWHWRGLTKQWLNHHVSLLPKIWLGAQYVPRLFHMPTAAVHDCRATESPCHRDDA